MEAQQPASNEPLRNDEQQSADPNSATEDSQEEAMELESLDAILNPAPDVEEPKYENEKSTASPTATAGRSTFINGLGVGLGIGCITIFVIMWIAIFFTPQLPPGATYENMLSIFVFPLVYLLAVGLIALTAGVVREYYTPRTKA